MIHVRRGESVYAELSVTTVILRIELKFSIGTVQFDPRQLLPVSKLGAGEGR